MKRWLVGGLWMCLENRELRGQWIATAPVKELLFRFSAFFFICFGMIGIIMALLYLLTK